MEHEGPQLETLTHRLSETPAEFLLPPAHRGEGTLDVAALVADHFRAMNITPPEPRELTARIASPGITFPRRLQLIALATWLLREPWFVSQTDLAPAMMKLFSDGFDAMAQAVDPATVTSDPDRREEFARLCLKHLSLRPRGETIAQAADRLNTLDSVERQRVVLQTRAAEARAKQVREMMAKKAAEEAAAKVSRE